MTDNGNSSTLLHSQSIKPRSLRASTSCHFCIGLTSPRLCRLVWFVNKSNAVPIHLFGTPQVINNC